MAKKKVDLTTPTSRRGLTTGQKYAARISKGRLLLYRRTQASQPGAWTVKLRAPERGTASGYVFARLGTADDPGAAGDDVLTYEEALAAAIAWAPAEEETAEPAGPYRVADAARDYLEWFREHRKSYRDTRYMVEANVLPTLGERPVEELTAEEIGRWHRALAKAPARLRGRRGDPKRKVRRATTEDAQRSRRATANRNLTVLRALCNHAVKVIKRAKRGEWSEVAPFKDADAARVAYLSQQEIHRLINSCPPDFRRLVQAALSTGARYGELAALRAEDFRPEAGAHGAIYFRTSKSGKARFTYLSPEGAALFASWAAGKPPGERLLTRADGRPWNGSQQGRPMAEAVKAAGVPRLTFHGLRHTYASLYLMTGGSLLGLAKQLGHADTRMVERHYGHLADDWRASEAAQHAPSVSLEPPKVVPMRAAARRRR